MRCSRAILCVFFVYLRGPLWLVLRMRREELARPLPTDYNCSPNNSLSLRGANWPAPTSCRCRDWKMVLGLIPQGFRWAADGAATARLRGMKAKSRPNPFWKHSATSDMPAVVTGRRRSVSGTPCDSPFAPPRSSPYAPIRPAPLLFRLASCFCGMSASGATGPSNTATLNSTCRGQLGSEGIRTYAFRRWRNVFWNRT